MIRGGGHSAWGGGPGGLTIDICALDAVEVDGTRVPRRRRRAVGAASPRARRARPRPQLRATRASVGVGGLTLGGGIGWMVRAWGLAADQLVGVQLVTAARRRRRGDGDRPPRAAVGAARRRRQLRRRDAVRFRGAPARRRRPRRLGLEGDARPVLRGAARGHAPTPRAISPSTYMDVPAMDPNVPPRARRSPRVLGRHRRGCRAASAGAALATRPGSSSADFGVQDYPGHPDGDARVRPERPDARVRRRQHPARRPRRRRAIDRLVGVPRAASGASVLFLRSRAAARYGDVAQDDYAPSPRETRRGSRWQGRSTCPGLVDDAERAPSRAACGTRSRLSAQGVYGNFTTSHRLRSSPRMYPADDAWRARRAIKRVWDPQQRLLAATTTSPGMTSSAAPRVGAALRRVDDVASVRVFGLDLGAVARPQGVERAGACRRAGRCGRRRSRAVPG